MSINQSPIIVIVASPSRIAITEYLGANAGTPRARRGAVVAASSPQHGALRVRGDFGKPVLFTVASVPLCPARLALTLKLAGMTAICKAHGFHDGAQGSFISWQSCGLT